MDRPAGTRPDPAPDLALIAFNANISYSSFRVALLDSSGPAAAVSVAGVPRQQLLSIQAGRVWDTDPAARVEPPRLGLVLDRAAAGTDISPRVLLAGLSNTDLEDIERGSLSIAALSVYAICISEELPAFRPRPDRPRRGCERCWFYPGPDSKCHYKARYLPAVSGACGNWKYCDDKTAKQLKV